MNPQRRAVTWQSKRPYIRASSGGTDNPIQVMSLVIFASIYVLIILSIIQNGMTHTFVVEFDNVERLPCER